MRTLEQLGISPAPWTANGNEVSSKAWDSFHGMSFDATVADCYNADNARLIAAAPELYEALMPFVSLMDWMLKNAARLNILDMVPRIREHGDRARAVLAKAGGEEAGK